MKRIDTPRSASAYQGAAGSGTGHFQDTDVAGGTQFDAEWCEAIQESIAGTIEGLGGTLDGTESGQLAGILVPMLTDDGAWTTRIRIGDPLGTGYETIIATEGGSVGPLFGYVETDKVFAAEGFYTGTQAAPVQRIDSDGDCDFRNVTLASGGVDGIVAVASTGRLATKGDLYAMGAIKVGTSDLTGTGGTIILDGATGDVDITGDLDVGSGNFVVDATSGDLDIAGEISAVNLDTATVAHNGDNDRVSGKVTLTGTSIAAGGAADLTHFNDRIGTSSIVLWSFEASTEGQKLAQGTATLSTGAVTFRVANFTAGVWPAAGTADLTASYVVINPV
jgi:hypothetical protein